MKNIFLPILIAAVVLASGCSNNKEAKAQSLLIEAISYSEGTPPSQAAQEAALKLAKAHGTQSSGTISGLSEREVIMVAGTDLCTQIITEYPTTQAAVKAAEVRNQIKQRLQIIFKERTRLMFDSNE